MTPRRSTPRRLLLAAALAALGCGPDAPAPAACGDPDRVTPPDRTVPYAIACCADAECADPPPLDGGGGGGAAAVCHAFPSGALCTRTCAADVECAGYGPALCADGVCAAP